MRISFLLPTDNKLHEYCIYCSSENIERIKKDAHVLIHCNQCGKESPRRIAIDPDSIWHVDTETQELIHESVGIFLSNPEGRILFFDRTVFPFAYTIPAGHLDLGETPLQAVQRELLEETGLTAASIELVSTEELVGDECSRGADIHLWHLYKGNIEKTGGEKIDAHEGGNPAWLTLSEAKEKNLTFPAHYFIDKYGDKLL